jgi:hypothetical protein
MTGGSIREFYTEEDSTGNLYDGSVHGDVTAFGKSIINIFGGTIHGKVNAFGTVNIRGGNKARSTSFYSTAASDPLDVFAIGQGTVQLFGSDLASSLVAADVFYEEGAVKGYFSKYVLAGVLTDGTDIAGTSLLVQNETGARFTLVSEVPEPGSLLLLGMGLWGIVATSKTAISRRPSRLEACHRGFNRSREG